MTACRFLSRTMFVGIALSVIVAAVPHCWETAAGASEPVAKQDTKAPVHVETLAEYLERTGFIVMVDGEWVLNTPDLPAWLGVNSFEHAHVWHNEDGRDRGFGGGLQIFQDTWVRNGCQEYAPTPARAVINDQIACGRRIKDAVDAEGHNGWTQWPRSSVAAGLR